MSCLDCYQWQADNRELRLKLDRTERERDALKQRAEDADHSVGEMLARAQDAERERDERHWECSGTPGVRCMAHYWRNTRDRCVLNHGHKGSHKSWPRPGVFHRWNNEFSEYVKDHRIRELEAALDWALGEITHQFRHKPMDDGTASLYDNAEQILGSLRRDPAKEE